MTAQNPHGQNACAVDQTSPVLPEEQANDSFTSVDASTDSEPSSTAEAASSGFDGFGFSQALLGTLAAKGYSEPSPIQRAAFPELMLGRDLVGQAQTGTGKTAAYLLPLLNKLLDKRKANEVRRTSVLILAPTRELAYQISDSIKAFSGSFKVRYITLSLIHI